VIGMFHSFSILCIPPGPQCYITTTTSDPQDTKSIAPPIPFTLAPGIIQFAKSAF